MNFQDLNLTINRLLSGYTIIELERPVIYKAASPETRYRISLLLKKFWQSNKFNFAQKSDLEFIFFDRGILDVHYKDKIKTLNERIDDAKYDLFMAGPLVEKEKKIRVQLQHLRDSLNSLYIQLSDTFYYSYEEVLDRMQVMYNILLNSFYDNGVPTFDLHNIDYSLFRRVSENIKRDSLSISDIRAVARSHEWRSYWSRGKEGCFINPVGSFNDEQKLLCSYSTMYDNALSRSDFPEYILEDDDKFDGWLIKQRRDAADENKAASIKSTSPSGKTYDFVTRAATTQEEANNIYGMNTREGLERIRSRSQQISTRK